MTAPGVNVTVTTEVGYCPFCQRSRNLRREERHLGGLVRTTVECESCHRTLSSTLGPPRPAPVEEPAPAPEPVVEPAPAPKKTVAARKPVGTKKAVAARKPAAARPKAAAKKPTTKKK